jgi:DNA-binding NarL/FixJ family response regulator
MSAGNAERDNQCSHCRQLIKDQGMRSKRILIADDHEIVRLGLRAILEAHEGWEIVAEVDNGKDAITAIIENKPDVAIVDYLLPLINGIEVARDIKSRQINTEILIFTMYDSDVLVKEAFKAGARGFLLKSDAKEQLRSAIEALLVHRPFFTGPVSEKILASYLSTNAPPMVALTPRERMVVQLIAEGQTNKSMAKVLNLSVKTIETHRASAMDKISVKSTAGLIRYAIKNMLIEP